MKQRTAIVLILLAVGMAALFITPQLLYPEPVFVIRLGLGAAIAALSLLGMVITLVFWWGGLRQSKESRQSLRQAQQEYEQQHGLFIQRLDHEIKNPLTGLNTELANLQASCKVATDERAIENAFRSLERISQIMENLRKLSELNDERIEHLPVDIVQLVDELVSDIQSLPKYAGRKISASIPQVPSRFPMVYGDRDLLNLAIFNILDNAIKFTSEQAAIEARIREDGQSVFIEIADNGGGIVQSELAYIFDELYRGRNARGIEGSGLGLSLAKRIIELHNGEITVRSHQGRPKATVFTIRLRAGGKP